MKKILAVLLAVLVAFSTFSIAVMAEEAEVETTAAAVEEGAESDLVQPENFTQLSLAVIFKAFEKVINFFIELIESIIPGVDLDNILSDGIGNLFGTVEDTTAAAVA